jgi:hypothetical protein
MGPTSTYVTGGKNVRMRRKLKGPLDADELGRRVDGGAVKSFDETRARLLPCAPKLCDTHDVIIMIVELGKNVRKTDVRLGLLVGPSPSLSEFPHVPHRPRLPARLVQHGHRLGQTSG